jgi:Ran GTPase-activating protein (RanGAP) involved in mRNA processing and transport
MKQEVILCGAFFCPGISQICQEKCVLGLLRNCFSKQGSTALQRMGQRALRKEARFKTNDCMWSSSFWNRP